MLVPIISSSKCIPKDDMQILVSSGKSGILPEFKIQSRRHLKSKNKFKGSLTLNFSTIVIADIAKKW